MDPYITLWETLLSGCYDKIWPLKKNLEVFYYSEDVF